VGLGEVALVVVTTLKNNSEGETVVVILFCKAAGMFDFDLKVATLLGTGWA